MLDVVRRNRLGTSVNSFDKNLFDEWCSHTSILCWFKEVYTKKPKSMYFPIFLLCATNCSPARGAGGASGSTLTPPHLSLFCSALSTYTAWQLIFQPSIDFSLQTCITMIKHTAYFVLADPTSLVVANIHLWHKDCLDQSSLSTQAESFSRTCFTLYPAPDGVVYLRMNRPSSAT